MKRILVSVSNDLNNDQRLLRTCSALAECNLDVRVIGRLRKDSTKIEFPFQTRRYKMLFERGFLFYALFNLRLFFTLLLSKKDLLFANDLDTLLPNYLMSKLQNKPLIFDSHELFSEVPELENRIFSKKVWKFLEDWMIPKLERVITVSDGIKEYYHEKYGIQAHVIRNVPIPENAQRKELKFISKTQKIIWYQGSVNIGRGLELMIDTIPLLQGYTLVIAGNGDILEELEHKVLKSKLEDKVKFLGKLSIKELKQLTPNASIGISLEEDLGLNYRYALPNKIFDYVHAHVPVIVSDLPDMARLVRKTKIGEVLEERSPEALSKLIMEIQVNDYSKQLTRAKEQLNWDEEKKKFMGIVHQSFRS